MATKRKGLEVVKTEDVPEGVVLIAMSKAERDAKGVELANACEALSVWKEELREERKHQREKTQDLEARIGTLKRAVLTGKMEVAAQQTLDLPDAEAH